MDNNTITIKSNDNTDVLIFIDKIQCVIERRNCVEIHLRDNVKIQTGATFSDIADALEALEGGAE